MPKRMSEEEYAVQVSLGLLPSREDIRKSVAAFPGGTLGVDSYNSWDMLIDVTVDRYIDNNRSSSNILTRSGYFSSTIITIDEKVEKVVDIFKQEFA